MAIGDTLVRINGEEVDLVSGSKVAVNYQDNDVGELTRVKADYTRTIRLSNTERNHKILNNSNKIGADEKSIYEPLVCDIINDGIYILAQGRAIVSGYDNKAGYTINILGGNFNFFDLIKGRTLRDLDFSGLGLFKRLLSKPLYQ